MTQPRAWWLAGFVVAATVTTTVLGACGGSGGGGKNSGRVAADSMNQGTAANLASRSAATLPGALPQPIDQMSGDDLSALTNNLSFVGGHERQRRCRGSDECRGANARRFTRLAVEAVDQEDSLGTANIPPNGVIAARLFNRGQVADTMYGTRPGYEYYLIVLPAAGGATWRLEEMTTSAPRQHRSIAAGKLQGCNHPYVRGARADFKTCAESAAETGDASRASLVRPVVYRPTQGFEESPIWFGCSVGCCTADPSS